MTNTLESMNLEEVEHLSPTTKKTQKIKEELDQVLLTQKGLEQIKENLSKMVDAMAHNPSFISRAASYWGELPLWQKIIAGTALTVPTLVIGIVFQIATFFAITIFSLFTYTTSSILLDNHHELNLNRTEHLKSGITNLANTLGIVILALDKIREQLATQVEQFQQENEKLTINVNDLTEEIQNLSEQSKLLKETESALRKTNTELELLSNSLQDSVKEHTELLKQNEEQLRIVQENYKENESLLTEKIQELKQVKLDMEEQIENLGNFTRALQGALIDLFSKFQLDSSSQKKFREKLELFLNDKEQSFHVIAERICESEEKLRILQIQYDALNQQYKVLNEDHQTLLIRGAQQIQRLEQLHLIPYQPSDKPATLLKKMGIYAVDVAEPPTAEEAPSHLAANY